MSTVRDSLDKVLQKREIILGLNEVVNNRIVFSTEEERWVIESLTRRALHPECRFDRNHRLMLYALAVAPEQVGWSFKLQEKIHRLLHKH